MGWGSSREGVGVEKFVPSLESLSSLGFEGRSLGCPGPLVMFKKLVQKSLCKKFVLMFQPLDTFNRAQKRGSFQNSSFSRDSSRDLREF